MGVKNHQTSEKKYKVLPNCPEQIVGLRPPCSLGKWGSNISIVCQKHDFLNRIREYYFLPRSVGRTGGLSGGRAAGRVVGRQAVGRRSVAIGRSTGRADLSGEPSNSTGRPVCGNALIEMSHSHIIQAQSDKRCSLREFV